MKFNNRSLEKDGVFLRIKQIVPTTYKSWYGNPDGSVWESEAQVIIVLKDCYRAVAADEGVYSHTYICYQEGTEGMFDDCEDDPNLVGVFPPGKDKETVEQIWNERLQIRRELKAVKEARLK